MDGDFRKMAFCGRPEYMITKLVLLGHSRHDKAKCEADERPAAHLVDWQNDRFTQDSEVQIALITEVTFY